jgi:uncharacterized membrane protein
MKNMESPLKLTNKLHLDALISLLIFFFFLGSIGGYLWEILLYLLKDGHFRNRGFLYGPWLPIYGTGGVMFFLLLGHSCVGISPCHFPRTKPLSPLTVFLSSAALGGTLELLVGWMLDKIWQLRYWDYSEYFLNLNGYICFVSIIGFAIAGSIWIGILTPFLQKLWFHIPLGYRRRINTLLVLLLLVDCTAALIFPNQGRGVTFP